MKKVFIIALLSSFFLLPIISSAQKSIKKVAKSACDCMEERQEYPDEMKQCLFSALVQNMSSLSKDFDIKSIEDIGNAEMAGQVSELMMERCPTALSIAAGMPFYEKDKKVDIESIKNGKYYYIEPNAQGKEDTIFVELKGSDYQETMENGKYFSKCGAAWKGRTLELTSIETNHPVKMEMSEPGQVFRYELIQIREEYLVYGIKNGEIYSYIIFFKVS